MVNFYAKLGCNRKYDRIGGLFQDRYKSEPVEDDSYFLTVLRYIDLNPVKAGICRAAPVYKGTSCEEPYASSRDMLKAV